MAADRRRLTLYDGRRRLGEVIDTGRGHQAVDAAGKRLGSFPTARAASEAMVAADLAGREPRP